MLAAGLLAAGTPVFAQQSSPTSARTSAKTANVATAAESRAQEDSTGALHRQSGRRRLAVQADLVWLGGFDELSADEIDKHMLDAIKAFQRRNGGKETGVLSDQERAALAQAAQAPQAAAGWRLIDDTATGARLGMPEKLVPHAARRPAPAAAGPRRSGQIQIETFRLHEASLPALFEERRNHGAAHAGSSVAQCRIPSSLPASSAEEFCRAGAVERQRSARRHHPLRSGHRRHHGAGRRRASRFIRRIPRSECRAAGGTQARRRIRQRDRGQRARRSRRARRNSPTIASPSPCRVLATPSASPRTQTNDLALLRLYGARNLVPAPLAGAGASSRRADAVRHRRPAGGAGGGTVTSAAAQLTAQGLDPAPKLGFSGAAAVDAQGRFAGMVALKAPVVAGIGPVRRRRRWCRRMPCAPFSRPRITAGQPASAAMEQSVVRVICVRK